MLIEGFSDEDRWEDRDVVRTSKWNSRDVHIETNFRDLHLFIIAKETQTSSGTSADVNAKADSQGNSSVQGTVEYHRESKDEKGNADRVTFEAKGNVDNKGNTSSEVSVKYEKTF